jgi:hypothetical protein
MALIVLHNMDSQGSRAPAAFKGADCVLRVTFTNNRINNLNVLHAAALHFPGANVVVWVGHGAENPNLDLRGHPVTDGKPVFRIDSGDLIRALTLFRPTRIYLFSCMAGRWVTQNIAGFADALRSDMSFQENVYIYATTTRILGAALGSFASGILKGDENVAGPCSRALPNGAIASAHRRAPVARGSRRSDAIRQGAEDSGSVF